ncbi:transposase domain-containing protein [Streptomyces pratens]|uniref:Transposase domain-containing protein n=1 Tax=Streptomyces pratens TaxID=887456 RepID=A0ABW1M5N5_9ACTN
MSSRLKQGRSSCWNRVDQDHCSAGAPLDAKSVVSHEVAVAAGPFAPGHLGELTRIVPFEMVDEVLAETGRTQQRIRDLPSRVVVYLLLAGSLFPGIGWQQVWQRLTAGLEGLETAAPTAGALAQARRRVGAGLLHRLFDLLRGPAAGVTTPGAWWRGLLVCAPRPLGRHGDRPSSRRSSAGFRSWSGRDCFDTGRNCRHKKGPLRIAVLESANRAPRPAVPLVRVG